MTRILGVLGLLVVLYGALIESNPAASSSRNLTYVANIQGRYGVVTLGALPVEHRHSEELDTEWQSVAYQECLLRRRRIVHRWDVPLLDSKLREKKKQQ